MSTGANKPKLATDDEKLFFGARMRFFEKYQDLQFIEYIIGCGKETYGIFPENVIVILVEDMNNIPNSVKAMPTNWEGYKVVVKPYQAKNSN